MSESEKATTEEPRRDSVPQTLQQMALAATLRAKGVPGQERALARQWLVHFPDTSARNILGRLRAFERRRAKAKVARASRKANRRKR